MRKRTLLGLFPVVPPHHEKADQTQEEGGRADAQQGVLQDLQQLDAGEELLLEHVGRLLVQLGRLPEDSDSVCGAPANSRRASKLAYLVQPDNREYGVVLDFLQDPAKHTFVCNQRHLSLAVSRDQWRRLT